MEENDEQYYLWNNSERVSGMLLCYNGYETATTAVAATSSDASLHTSNDLFTAQSAVAQKSQSTFRQ